MKIGKGGQNERPSGRAGDQHGDESTYGYESQIFTSGFQFIDVGNDDRCRSSFHAISFELFLCHRQERGASNLLFSQNVQRGITNSTGKFGLKFLDEWFRVPSIDAGD